MACDRSHAYSGVDVMCRAGYKRCAVLFDLDRSFRRGLRRGRALRLSCRDCTLKRSEEYIRDLRVKGVITLEEEREMVALRLIECNKPYCRTYTRVV